MTDETLTNGQCDTCVSLSQMAHWELSCPGRVPGCIGTTIDTPIVTNENPENPSP